MNKASPEVKESVMKVRGDVGGEVGKEGWLRTQEGGWIIPIKEMGGEVFRWT